MGLATTTPMAGNGSAPRGRSGPRAMERRALGLAATREMNDQPEKPSVSMVGVIYYRVAVPTTMIACVRCYTNTSYYYFSHPSFQFSVQVHSQSLTLEKRNVEK